MMQGFVKEKEFYKQAACIAIPISLQSVITIGVSMMDNIMVGALGETALSAVALANQFIGIYQIGCMGIGMGASVLTARFWGMKDITSLKKVVTIMFRICIGLALLVFMAPTLLIPDRLMRIYTEEAEVIAQGVLYYRWMVPCYLLHGLTLTSTLILRSAGQVQIPLVSSAGAFFVNIFSVPSIKKERNGATTMWQRWRPSLYPVFGTVPAGPLSSGESSTAFSSAQRAG